MAGWYQRFIANYAAIVAPITDLIGKKRFDWTDEAQLAFTKLKQCLTTSPVLSHPDFSRPFVGVGSVLFQVDDDGQERPIAFMSRKFNSAQRNYSVTEQECLTAILSLKKFRAYVEGMRFKIITDHASLKWLMSQKELSGRLARWSLKLQGFDFDIEYRKGSANVVPDALSRAFVDELVVDQAHSGSVDLSSPHFSSTEYEELKNSIGSKGESLPGVKIEGEHVFKRSIVDIEDEAPEWKLWMPTELRDQVIKCAHDPPIASHRGYQKTLEKVRSFYFWPGMANDVRQYVSKCSICKETKAPNATLRPPMGQQLVVERPWQHVYIDLLGPYPRSKAGNVSLLIVLDKFTKYVLLKPLYKASESRINKYLEDDVFLTYGVPESILSDNGVQFRAKTFQELLRTYGVSHMRTATHSPQANASERVNRSILAAIRAYIGTDQRDWDKNIHAISCALRSTVHNSTSFSPYFLMFGCQMVQHGSAYELLRKLNAVAEPSLEVVPPTEIRSLVHRKVVEKLQIAHELHKKTYNTRCRIRSYTAGQEVYYRVFDQSNFAKGFNQKLGKQWRKARVKSGKGTAMYNLEDLQGKPISMCYHAKDIRP